MDRKSFDAAFNAEPRLTVEQANTIQVEVMRKLPPTVHGLRAEFLRWQLEQEVEAMEKAGKIIALPLD
jgi:hypothetical protein